ncbi:hypothetical protein XA68_15196 [Ophiocordyceps unilateralis]|uniref:Protein kinase domain-containing protein n=1 Tax=Ophiocordyceps unilateralis TaxID=268505 RepID=A0A2A9P904_OPHUN|nr:hypothetical protein XA68_15196 [Ophiocordyceps unilateralis]
MPWLNSRTNSAPAACDRASPSERRGGFETAIAKNMSSDGYVQTRKKLWCDIYKKLENREHERFRFAPRGSSERALNDDNLHRFLLSLGFAHLPVSETDFAERMQTRQLYDFLATLIYASCDAEAARCFVLKLVAADSWPVKDARGKPFGPLPTDKNQLRELFDNDTADVDKFFSSQACFCPVVLKKGKEVVVKDLNSERLPYLIQTETEDQISLGKGSFGEVFKVMIAKGHFLNDDGDANQNVKRLARKDYHLSDISEARAEYDNMKKIFESQPFKSRNLVECLGSLHVGSDYSLFMPLATCDLNDYMLKHHRAKPGTLQAKADIIRCTAGLADGLHYLHEVLESPECRRLVCYHMDLKPHNILVFNEGNKPPIWKISDFGQSRVKEQKSKGNGNGNTASGTRNGRGEGTFLAPESVSKTRLMQKGSDIWSLGCIISVIFTYLEEGAAGVEKYTGRREDHRSKDDESDRFFLPSHSPWKESKVHPVVKQWHNELITKAASRDAQEGDAVEQVLKVLESTALQIEPSKRRDEGKIRQTLKDTLEKYQNLGKAVKGSISGSSGRTSHTWTNVLQSKPTPLSGAEVRVWRAETTEKTPDDYKGCLVSPDAAFVVYWTDVKIVLYAPQSLEGDRIQASSEYTLEEINCIWESVCISRKSVVAYTKGPNYCYIFNSDSDGVINLDNGRRIELRLPKVHKLAISPDGATLVCVAQHEAGRANVSQLFYAAVSDLVSNAVPRRDGEFRGRLPSISSTPSLSTVPEPAPVWKRLTLYRPAEDVVLLSVLDSKEVYLAGKLEATERRSVSQFPILYVSLAETKKQAFYFQSMGYGIDGPSSFFTTLCPFPGNAMGAVVTHETKLEIFGCDPDCKVDKDIPKYRVRRLLLADRNRKFFALGASSTNHRMRLLEIQMPRRDAELSVKALGQLPGLRYEDDDFSEMLFEDGDEVLILVAALNRKIYRVSVR